MKMGDRIPALIRTLQSVAEWATRLEPNGVSLRFLNFQGDMDGRFDGLTNQAEIADKIYNVKTGIYTRLGTILRDKILQHMAGKESPLIVVIITDGEVRFPQYPAQTRRSTPARTCEYWPTYLTAQRGTRRLPSQEHHRLQVPVRKGWAGRECCLYIVPGW